MKNIKTCVIQSGLEKETDTLSDKRIIIINHEEYGYYRKTFRREL